MALMAESAVVRPRSSSRGSTRKRIDAGCTGGYASHGADPMRSPLLAPSIKDAVAGVASPALAGASVSRPSSRGAVRRPAPKVITEGAISVGASSPNTPTKASELRSSPSRPGAAGMMGVSGLLSTDLRAPLPAAARKSSQPTVTVPDAYSQAVVSPTKVMGLDLDASVGASCAISVDRAADTEIRTKVFRMGAPLLRSTIPVTIGSKPRETKEARRQRRAAQANDDGDAGGSDVETIMSLSDCDVEDQPVALSVTLDFPC